MELTETVLCRTDWVERAEPFRRLKFRRDGTGYYEREALGEKRFVHENLLYRVDGERLHLKFAHARLWTEVSARLAPGLEATQRLGERVLSLAQDPYASTLEETATAELTLESDSGAALPQD